MKKIKIFLIIQLVFQIRGAQNLQEDITNLQVTIDNIETTPEARAFATIDLANLNLQKKNYELAKELLIPLNKQCNKDICALPHRKIYKNPRIGIWAKLKLGEVYYFEGKDYELAMKLFLSATPLYKCDSKCSEAEGWAKFRMAEMELMGIGSTDKNYGYICGLLEEIMNSGVSKTLLDLARYKYAYVRSLYNSCAYINPYYLIQEPAN
ncbi:MAG: hypothetical protein P4L22_05200 [Candidatus Babeliales bacterium]|nr:hypothetical protein [Candidatus Babeliales bacterium]